MSKSDVIVKKGDKDEDRRTKKQDYSTNKKRTIL